MLNPRLFEKPLTLSPGTMGLYKVKGKLLVICVQDNTNGLITYTYPLKKDGIQHTALQSEIYLPLAELQGFSQLSLTRQNENLAKRN